MYTVLLIILLIVAGLIVRCGVKSKKKGISLPGLLFAALTLFFFWLLGFWGEMLWFQNLGYGSRFWSVVLSKFFSSLIGAIIGLLYVFIFTLAMGKKRKFLRIIACVVAGFIGANWGYANWAVFLKFFHAISTNVTDPIIGMNTGFYLFKLPFYDSLYTMLMILSIISLFTLVVSKLFTFERGQVKVKELQGVDIDEDSKPGYGAIYFNAGIVVLALAFGKLLERYHLMYSSWGAVHGPGWTDVHLRFPAYSFVVIITIIAALFLIVPQLRKILQNKLSKGEGFGARRRLSPIIMLGIILVVVWILALEAVPRLFQWLRVEPNEITMEKPYIANNIEFTRMGFRLDVVEEREFPVGDEFTPEMVSKNENIFKNIRLWDWRALDAVYKQFQEIRLYYEFVDVDIDRYTLDNSYRQVMVSARELLFSNLPTQSQTFVNRRFKYTHGYGITLTNVSEFTPQGLPNLLIKNIPPVSEFPELEVKVPQLYYGELTSGHVIVNSEEPEFDFPKGEENVYTHYAGTGGVQISNFWRKFLYGWKFDGTRLLLSGYPTKNSRIMFHRQIKDRVRTLAPFLEFDDDPYVVLNDGKLFWVIDAYTTSGYYPYSEPYRSSQMIEKRNIRSIQNLVANSLRNINYIRNSVKIVIDAYNGTTDFYIYDEEDPIIQVWSKIFPDMFKTKTEMPVSMQKHVRYPGKMLLIQGLVYAKYHMNDPAVFYNQEDLWIRATEKYYNSVQPVEPYYIMWEIPETNDQEFVMILPFTPKKRQVLIGWIAGMCDGENYGRLIAYKFPKEKRILGPQQVETKIDQDSFLSGQLTLWDQRGSSVIRGNVLAIPVENTIIYVEPIYLQSDTAAYPELRLVAIMHGDELSYAETFDKALQGLFEKQTADIISEKEVGNVFTIEEKIQQASNAFDNYIKSLGDKRYNDAARALQELENALKNLSDQGAFSTGSE
ncbi:MAG TPA: UPF0182 family protein [Candidatus Cloacimonetes bacterium]|nr:UPF0182 family protein [Candidatus Cloacimonadota bacterium]HEX38132.1 UPF0182 family protein [Candidatus Cloacimonadota bacterium]